MKINMAKHHGGLLSPASDMDSDAMQKFKTGEIYAIEIKRTRNPGFHRKAFEFLNFCFAHWKSDREFMDEAGQFKVFRNNLTVIAGYYDEYYTIKGEVRIEAKSLSFANMSQTEFESCYKALVNAALKTIFKGCGKEVEERLLGFF